MTIGISKITRKMFNNSRGVLYSQMMFPFVNELFQFLVMLIFYDRFCEYGIILFTVISLIRKHKLKQKVYLEYTALN